MSLFGRYPDLKVVAEAGSVEEAILMAREHKPEIILMDFELPDGTGLDATRAILAELPNTKIIFLTVHETDDRLIDAIRAGAKGYMLKNIAISPLIAALRGVERGEVALSRSMTTQLVHELSRSSKEDERGDMGLDSLSVREREILNELATNATNQEIASRLFISENTVKNHVHNILKKFGLKNRREAIQMMNHQAQPKQYTDHID